MLRSGPPALVALALLCAAGCSLTPRPVETVLDRTLDARCAAAVAAYRQNSGDAELALQATRLLFATADVTVQEALVVATRSIEASDATAMLAGEKELPSTIRDRVLSLATTGVEAAEAALAPESTTALTATARIDAQVHLALHLTFVAWANGTVRSLMAGYGGRITTAMDTAMAADPLWDNGAPLRLKGRFLSKAPWPVGDSDAALELLQRAVEHAPLPIHHLFLGDLLHQRGDRDGAVREWRAVLTSTPDDTTRAVVGWHREMATLRLQAARR